MREKQRGRSGGGRKVLAGLLSAALAVSVLVTAAPAAITAEAADVDATKNQAIYDYYQKAETTTDATIEYEKGTIPYYDEMLSKTIPSTLNDRADNAWLDIEIKYNGRNSFLRNPDGGVFRMNLSGIDKKYLRYGTDYGSSDGLSAVKEKLNSYTDLNKLTPLSGDVIGTIYEEGNDFIYYSFYPEDLTLQNTEVETINDSGYDNYYVTLTYEAKAAPLFTINYVDSAYGPDEAGQYGWTMDESLLKDRNLLLNVRTCVGRDNRDAVSNALYEKASAAVNRYLGVGTTYFVENYDFQTTGGQAVSGLSDENPIHLNQWVYNSNFYGPNADAMWETNFADLDSGKLVLRAYRLLDNGTLEKVSDFKTEGAWFKIGLKASGTIIFTIDAADTATAQPARLRRFYNAWSGEHFYTADDAEAATLTPAYGWAEETSDDNSFKVLPKTSTKTSYPVYRLFNAFTNEHFFTVDEEEKNAALDANCGWVYEGIAFRAATENDTGTVVVYRMHLPLNDAHLFTASEDEMGTLLDSPWGWELEFVAFDGFQ